MSQHPHFRVSVSAIAASILVLGLAACSMPVETTPRADSGNSTGVAGESPDSSQSGGTDCNWEEERLVVTDPTPPTDKQGDLAETLVGAWQFTHYDLGLGGGWESWTVDNDRRYVYSDSSELVHCVILTSGDNPSELAVIYTVTADQIMLSNGSGVTAVAWTKDLLLLSNHQDDSLELMHRR